MEITINSKVSAKITSESDFEIFFKNRNGGSTYYFTDYGATILYCIISRRGKETKVKHEIQELDFKAFEIHLRANQHHGEYPAWLKKYLVWNYPKVEKTFPEKPPRKKQRKQRIKNQYR